MRKTEGEVTQEGIKERFARVQENSRSGIWPAEGKAVALFGWIVFQDGPQHIEGSRFERAQGKYFTQVSVHAQIQQR